MVRNKGYFYWPERFSVRKAEVGKHKKENRKMRVSNFSATKYPCTRCEGQCFTDANSNGFFYCTSCKRPATAPMRKNKLFEKLGIKR